MKKKVNRIIIFSVLVVFVFSFSCKNNPNFSSLREVSYSEEIAPIISANCSASGCHGAIDFKELSLVTYDDMIKGGITAGSPKKSKIYNSLISYGEDLMPKKPFNELTEKQIQLIYVWIGQGAKNN